MGQTPTTETQSSKDKANPEARVNAESAEGATDAPANGGGGAERPVRRASGSGEPSTVGESASGSRAAARLPLPEHKLSPHPDGGGYLLEIQLPKVVRSSEVELQISPRVVEVEVPGVYSPLHVTLPRYPAVDDDNATARFDTKQRTLRLSLPTTTG